jgi:hypothetical protein
MRKPRVSEIASNVSVVKMGRGPLSTNVYFVRSQSWWTLVDAGWSGSERKIQLAAESGVWVGSLTSV